jgi:hypothetical protein
LDALKPLGRKAFRRFWRVSFLLVKPNMVDAYSTPGNVAFVLGRHMVAGDDIDELIRALKVPKRMIRRADLRLAIRILQALLQSRFSFPSALKQCWLVSTCCAAACGARS